MVKPEMPEWERADGEEGLLLVRGPGVFQGYWGNPEATAEAFHGDYLITGAHAPRRLACACFLGTRGEALRNAVLQATSESGYQRERAWRGSSC